MISDHWVVYCQLSMRKPDFHRRELTFRKLRCVDRECFMQDIRKFALIDYHIFGSVSHLTDCYESTLSSLLEHHAPSKKRVVTLRPVAPRYTDQIRVQQAKRRELERLWRKSKLIINRELYFHQCIRVNKLIPVKTPGRRFILI